MTEGLCTEISKVGRGAIRGGGGGRRGEGGGGEKGGGRREGGRRRRREGGGREGEEEGEKGRSSSGGERKIRDDVEIHYSCLSAVEGCPLSRVPLYYVLNNC